MLRDLLHRDSVVTVLVGALYLLYFLLVIYLKTYVKSTAEVQAKKTLEQYKEELRKKQVTENNIRTLQAEYIKYHKTVYQEDSNLWKTQEQSLREAVEKCRLDPRISSRLLDEIDLILDADSQAEQRELTREKHDIIIKEFRKAWR